MEGPKQRQKGRTTEFNDIDLNEDRSTLWRMPTTTAHLSRSRHTALRRQRRKVKSQTTSGSGRCPRTSSRRTSESSKLEEWKGGKMMMMEKEYDDNDEEDVDDEWQPFFKG